MLDVFLKYLNAKAELSHDELEMIKPVCVQKKIRKHQYLLQEGDVCRFNYFICKGFVRWYFVDRNGLEHIIQFAPENHWTGDRDSLATEQPSKYNIDALEDSEVILIRQDDLELLCKSIPAFNNLINTILQKSFCASIERVRVNITCTAHEKYHSFISKYPSFANRIPQHMIASYLGMSPETLSRIKKQSVKKKIF
jgi:CRP-like cAMP-binding protein